MEMTQNKEQSAPEQPQVSLLLDAKAENLMLVRQVIEGVLEGRPELDDIKLAVTEACGNVVKHAYGNNTGDRPGAMQVTLALRSGGCRIEVSDNGSWEAPGSTRPELPGMGVVLMRKLATRSEIAVSDDGTRVALEFEWSTT